jgi:PrcB C-terminal
MALTEALEWTGDRLPNHGRGPAGAVGPGPYRAPCGFVSRVARVALVLSCAGMVGGVARAETGLPLRTIALGSRSRVLEPLEIVARAPAEWAALWARHSEPGVPLPPVDFAREMVVAVFLGRRSTSDYQVRITSADEVGTGPDLEVTYREFDAAAGTVRRPVITMPFHIVALPRSAMSVRFRRLPA